MNSRTYISSIVVGEHLEKCRILENLVNKTESNESNQNTFMSEACNLVRIVVPVVISSIVAKVTQKSAEVKPL